QHVGPGDRKSRLVQRPDHLVLAVHRMRRRQQLARRLAAQGVALAAGGDAVSGVRLAALELLDRERAAESFHALAEKFFQPARVNAMAFFNWLYADELVGHANGNPNLKMRKTVKFSFHETNSRHPIPAFTRS